MGLDPRTKRIEEDGARLILKQLAQEQKDGSYPQTIGSDRELNDRGELLLKMNETSFHEKMLLDPDGEDNDWRTFRDINPIGFTSLYSGNEAARLKSRWIELDDHDINL